VIMTDETPLTDKVIAVHRALDAATVPHAFGGALALAYCTGEPRATRDIDVNVFVAPETAGSVLGSLHDGVAHDDDDVAGCIRYRQIRLWWARTPLDLFFGYHHFHDHAAGRVRRVPFADTVIPVLDGTDLVVFKALFDRPRDWVDIAAIADVEGADLVAAGRWLSDLVGDDDQRVRRLAEIREASLSQGPTLAGD